MNLFDAIDLARIARRAGHPVPTPDGRIAHWTGRKLVLADRWPTPIHLPRRPAAAGAAPESPIARS